LGVFVALAFAREQYGSSSVGNFTFKQVIKLPYTYIANNFWNLDYALNPQPSLAGHPTTYGIDHFTATVPFFGSSFRKSCGWDSAFNESISKIRRINSVNYLWEIYKDFGGIGVAFVPFFWGLLVTWLYLRLKSNLQMKLLLLYSLAIIMVGLWWFNIWYKITFMYGFWVLAIFVIAEFCQKKISLKNG
jgi:oligosaccharide repeat unit polymerase